MCRKHIFFLSFFLLGLTTFGQEVALSPLSKISLLTVGTGQELAAKFGHSAIRVQDPTLGVDEVYGYGTYDFDDPNFYLNFTRGKLSYTISRIPFRYFKMAYEQEERWIKEQELDLDLQQRNNIVTFLENNLLPENKKYKYDFLFDNCATRIPMVFEKTLGPSFQFDYDYLQERYTFRQLIRQNLNPNTWSNFGIDLALGAVIDRRATPYEHLFLPIYVYKQMRHTTLGNGPVVKKESVLLDIPEKADRPIFLLTPVFWLGLLLLLVAFMTYKDHQGRTRRKWLDVALFSLTGLAGILILFLWFLTDHEATKENYNALWAFAPNLIVAFFLTRQQLPQWMGPYMLLLMLLLGVTVVFWTIGLQSFSILLILPLLALAMRYLFLYRFISHQKK
jgi:hypothetical protein